ncbi:hypothetical protein OG21DRAFT_1527923 [Imleria badia]|nr:hypothetical protein OG21DRAFT_1527923 [Imleria badia]
MTIQSLISRAANYSHPAGNVCRSSRFLSMVNVKSTTYLNRLSRCTKGWGMGTCTVKSSAEPAASVPPTEYPSPSLPQALPAYSTSLHMGKECQASPVPICSLLPYEDIHNVEPVTGPSAFETIQGTLFPEFTGQEYPKNTSILGEGINRKGDQTLFRRMGDYVYAYQKDAIKFKDRIMDPICLYNSVEELCTIFKASHSKEEGRAPSYHQASDIITFLNHWRKHKNLVECITSEPIWSPLGGSNTTSGTVTPIPLLARVNEQSVPDTTPASHISAETTTCPQRKIILNFKTTFLPQEAPMLTTSINDWSKFIKRCWRACPEDRRGGLRKMFLGAGIPPHGASRSHPSVKPRVDGLGMGSHTSSPGAREVLSSLDWVMADLQHDGPVAWISEFTNQVTMTDIAAYLAANGVTIHDTDDAVWWAHSVAREMLNRIDESGGSDNPSTAAPTGPYNGIGKCLAPTTP